MRCDIMLTSRAGVTRSRVWNVFKVRPMCIHHFLPQNTSGRFRMVHTNANTKQVAVMPSFFRFTRTHTYHRRTCSMAYSYSYSYPYPPHCRALTGTSFHANRLRDTHDICIGMKRTKEQVRSTTLPHLFFHRQFTTNSTSTSISAHDTDSRNNSNSNSKSAIGNENTDNQKREEDTTINSIAQYSPHNEEPTPTPVPVPQQTTNKEIIKRIMQIARPEMKLILASAATLGVTSSITLLLPYTCGQVLDMAISSSDGGDGNGNGNFSPFVVACGLFGLTGTAGLGVYARSLMLNIAGNRIVSRMRRRLFASILSQEIAFFDRTKPGDLISRLSNDAYFIKSVVTTEAVSALRGVVMSLGSTSFLFYTSPTLAVVSLMSIPPVFVGARMVGRNLRERQKEVQELHGKHTNVAEEVMGRGGIQTVQQFVTEEHEFHKYSDAVHRAHEKEIEVGRTKAAFDGAVHVAANGVILGVLGYGGTLVLAGEMSAGDLTGFLMYSLLMAGNISSLSGNYAEMMKSLAAANRTFEIIDRTPEIASSVHVQRKDSTTRARMQEQEKEHPDKLEPMSIMFENITFAYPTRSNIPVLGPNFNLTVEPGSVVAIVGGSGSGKSTIAAIITRMYDTDEDCGGKVFIDGNDILELDPSWLRKQIGIVSQEPLLFAGSIADNIRYGRLDASDEDIIDAAKAAHVLDFADTLPKGLDTQVGDRGTQLSGGQKQRVAIARTILKDPPIIILDEATSALDAQSEFHVHQALNTIMKGRTVISIAHRLSTIREADTIAVLQNGIIVESGTFKELVNSDSAFRDLMNQQITNN